MMFAIGQRWISESENNLGLGIITAVDVRSVSILFPAAEEQRIYALESAPLLRVLFRVGDMVAHQEGWQGRVLEVIEQSSTLSYVVERLDKKKPAVIREIELAAQLSFSKPQDLLFSLQIDRSDRFALRYQALQHQQAQFQSPLRGLRGIRATLIPHQLHIAKEVGQRIAPRVLLADEVGLGKTIEAGMILQQQIFAGKAERVLVIVPENLQHQWLVEMLRRFNLNFSLFDEERCADFEPMEGDVDTNPFESEAMIICALDWLVAKPKRAKQLLAANFDLMIVDEAHHLLWQEHNPSLAYQLITQLSECIPAVLLLTATPEQLGQSSHFARLSLLDPDRFYSYQAFLQEQKNYQPVARAVQCLLTNKALSSDEQKAVTELLAEQNIESLLRLINSTATRERKQKARQQLIESLIDRHGTSRLLFRNTRQGVKGFPHRIFHEIILPLPSQYTQLFSQLNLSLEEIGEGSFYPEYIFQRASMNKAWWNFDPRVEWLITFLKNHRQEKVLVICRHADTAIQLEQILREKEGIRSAVFHEKMSIVERDRASAYFAQQEEGAQVLLSSSIGSEGRNFQFACHLVLFNVPNNPDLLEQCIGRLDRIGQSRDVQIYVPCFAHSGQLLLTRWYHEGLNAFEETCPMGATLFEQYGAQLQHFLQTDTEPTEFDDFIQQTRQQRQILKQELEQGRDLLLELNSNGGEQAQQLAQAIEEEDGSPELVNFALGLFDIIGLEQEELGTQSLVIQPTGHMLVPDFPGLKEEGVTLTFDRQLALVREEFEFLTWDHPMICHGIDLITSGEIGKTAVSLLVNKALPVGTTLLELIYVVETQSAKDLQLTRFLPPTPIRLLLDSNGNDLADRVSFNKLERQLKPMNKKSANQLVKMMRTEIETLLQQAESRVKQPAQQIIRQAQQLANQQLSAELQRLQALQTVNKNIRADEISGLIALREKSLTELKQANWRLDSLRLIMSNKE